MNKLIERVQEIFYAKEISEELYPLGETEPSRAAVRKAWKNFVKTKNPTSSHMVVLNVLLGRPLKYGFSPATNEIKLKNGRDPWQGFSNALHAVRFSKSPSPWDLSWNEEKKPEIFSSKKSQDFWIEKTRESQ